MYEHMRLEVTSGSGCVVAEVTLEALFTLVRFKMSFELIAVRKGLVAALAG